MKNISTYTWIGIPDGFVTVLILILISVFLAPWFGGTELGPLKIPKFENRQSRFARIVTFSLIFILLIGFFPFWNSQSSKEQSQGAIGSQSLPLTEIDIQWLEENLGSTSWSGNESWGTVKFEPNGRKARYSNSPGRSAGWIRVTGQDHPSSGFLTFIAKWEQDDLTAGDVVLVSRGARLLAVWNDNPVIYDTWNKIDGTNTQTPPNSQSTQEVETDQFNSQSPTKLDRSNNNKYEKNDICLSANLDYDLFIRNSSDCWEIKKYLQNHIDAKDCLAFSITERRMEGVCYRDADPTQNNITDKTFVLTNFEFDGPVIVPENYLYDTYKEFLGKEISVSTIYKVVEKANLVYRDSGYIFTRVIVPPQTLENGIVQLSILESKISQLNIVWTGNEKKLNDEQFSKSIYNAESLIKNLRVIKNISRDDIVNTISQINKIPNVRYESIITRIGDSTGEVDLEIKLSLY